jgi:O-antigen ligase
MLAWGGFISMDTWRGAYITGSLTVVLIFATLFALGANSAALASYFGVAALTLLCLALIFAPPTRVRTIMGAHALTLAGAFGFALLALATALPVSLSPWPLQAPLSDLRGADAALSLAPYRTIEGVASFGAVLACFVLGALCGVKRKEREWLAAAIGLFTIGFALWALFVIPESGSRRLDARLGSANTAATLFGVLWLFASATCLRALHHVSPHGGSLARAGRALATAPISIAALLLSLLCLGLTLSRGGFLAAAAGVSVLLAATSLRVVRPAWGKALLLTAIIAAIGAACAFVFFVRAEIAGGGLSTDINVTTRQTLMGIQWQAFLERPLLGYGLNTYHDVSALKATPENWEAVRTAGAAHNIYLQALAETGLIGGFLLLIAALGPLTRAWRNLLRERGVESSAAVVAIATLVLVHGLVDFGLQTPAIAALVAFITGAFVTPPRPDPASSARRT